MDMNLIRTVVDDVDTKLLTADNDGVIMVISKNDDHIDNSMVVEHLVIVALKMLHLPDFQDCDVKTASDLVGVTLLDNTVASAVRLL